MENKETEEFFFLKVVKHGLEYRLVPMEEDHFEGKVVGKAKVYKEKEPHKKTVNFDTSRIVQGL